MIHHTSTKFTSPPLRGAMCALFVIIAVYPSASAAEGAQTHAPRHWTSTDGRTLKGTFVNADESKVTLRRTDGRVVDIPITQLAEEDRRLVAATIEAQQADPEVKESRQYLTYILPDGSENWDPERTLSGFSPESRFHSIPDHLSTTHDQAFPTSTSPISRHQSDPLVGSLDVVRRCHLDDADGG